MRLSPRAVTRTSALLLVILGLARSSLAEARPNILWLSCEDIGPHLGCYGDRSARTPNLDAFATEGVLFNNAFATAGVCAPCRSAIITGMYQTSLGTHHMRCSARLPAHIRPFPCLLREAGYYCTNNSKQDYQFSPPADTWDESSRTAHWQNRPRASQPFFAVFNYTGCHESGIQNLAKYETVTRGLARQDRAKLAAATLPPYYPNTAVVREDWGRYYDVITAMDRWFAERLQELEQSGVAENTIVFFWSDHGAGLPRAKRWLYDSGIRVPLMVRVPEKFRSQLPGRAGQPSERLVSLIDLGPTTLALAGVAVPRHMQGQAFMGSNAAPPREYVFAARDRMDERYDVIRAVRDNRFKYLRNYEPLKTYYQYMNTPEKGATMREIRRLAAQGQLPPAAAALMAPSKPSEELYDTRADPHEVRNLASDPAFGRQLLRLRKAHLDWVTRTRDLGLVPEPVIADLEQHYGSRYAILQGDQALETLHRLRDAASASLEGIGALPKLKRALSDVDAAVRYWGAVGLGNLAQDAATTQPLLRERLADESAVVRVAAARALCRMGDTAAALPTLVDVLDNGKQWERLHAANVLDEIDEDARSVLEAMRRNKAYRAELVQRGKYTVRVLNRALNQLLGASEVVR